MGWEIEYTDEFGNWWASLAEGEQTGVDAHVRKLEQRGPNLPFPYSSGVAGSRHPRLRELRVQVAGKPLRVFYAFDPRRTAILLIGGDKTGDGRFYERMIPVADTLYDTHLLEIQKERRDDREASLRGTSSRHVSRSPGQGRSRSPSPRRGHGHRRGSSCHGTVTARDRADPADRASGRRHDRTASRPLRDHPAPVHRGDRGRVGDRGALSRSCRDDQELLRPA
ncbi:hypothetical protein D3272_20005 [Lichenibacterium ramalinae]|uniref:Addiction module toxin RelE n=1 Tax=Lichenibacterium ramalinae TaxID=2316527 RepID=A0A4V1RI81_9HYPH|nr:hypothetical protein D3272_20005 [Lichenibacterium ramalinae]